MGKWLIFITLFCFSFSLVGAFDFTINIGNLPNDLYEGHTENICAQITASSSNYCDMKCEYNFKGSGDWFADELVAGDQSNEFCFEVEATKSDHYEETLTVHCTKQNVFCTSEDVTKPKIITFSTTYCGDNKIQSSYEDCNSCSEDVGKCDLENCIYGNECEGGYCIHEICWNKPYKESDGFCDTNEGENCKNSVGDCGCGVYERCGSSGICETYCGNGQCEESERGICKLDCDWCGDGECNNNEKCESCEEDCGVCENTKLNEQIANQTQEVIQQGLSESASRQKMIYSTGAIIIVLFVIVYLSIKGVKHKKNAKKRTKEKTKK